MAWRWRDLSVGLCVSLLEFNPYAQWAHIRPHLFNILQTVLFGILLANIASAERILVVGRPHRILFLVVDEDLVYCDHNPCANHLWRVASIQTHLPCYTQTHLPWINYALCARRFWNAR